MVSLFFSREKLIFSPKTHVKTGASRQVDPASPPLFAFRFCLTRSDPFDELCLSSFRPRGQVTLADLVHDHAVHFSLTKLAGRPGHQQRTNPPIRNGSVDVG
jgi:hypothetical protein